MTSSPRPNPLEQLTLDELRRRTSQKWQAHDAELLPLWVAEMDVPLAPPVADAIRHAIDIGDTGYASRHGYAEAVAEFADSRWGWPDLPVAHTRVLAEVMTGIVEVLRVSTDPGDSVIVMSPVYAPFFSYIAHAGRHVVEAPLTPGGRLDPDAVAAAIERVQSTGGRCVVLLCNPHNPTGTVHNRSELEALALIACSTGVRVLADEIHGPLVLAGADFIPYLTVAGSEDAIIFTSASKGWNLAGLKAAIAIAGPKAAPDLRSVPAEIDYAPSHLGVISHIAAFRYGTDWLDDLLAGLDANRTLLGRLLNEHLPQVSWIPPEGTYLAWLNCQQLAVARTAADNTTFAVATDIDGPAKLFRDRARVALNSGHIFGSGGDGYVRLNFATSSAILALAVTRMGEAVAGRG